MKIQDGPRWLRRVKKFQEGTIKDQKGSRRCMTVQEGSRRCKKVQEGSWRLKEDEKDSRKSKKVQKSFKKNQEGSTGCCGINKKMAG